MQRKFKRATAVEVHHEIDKPNSAIHDPSVVQKKRSHTAGGPAMSITQPRRLRISTLCLAVVWVAVAASLVRYREVWAALNVRNIGYPAAICLYVWFWVGLALVMNHPATTQRRFFGLAGHFLSMVIVPSVLPQTQLVWCLTIPDTSRWP
jgi:hypothetical protein